MANIPQSFIAFIVAVLFAIAMIPVGSLIGYSAEKETSVPVNVRPAGIYEFMLDECSIINLPAYESFVKCEIEI